MNDDNKDALNNLINSIQEKMNGNESSQKEENNSSFDLSSILNAFNQNKEENKAHADKTVFGCQIFIEDRQREQKQIDNSDITHDNFCRQHDTDQLNNNQAND